jgi:hypothetical protein
MNMPETVAGRRREVNVRQEVYGTTAGICAIAEIRAPGNQSLANEDAPTRARNRDRYQGDMLNIGSALAASTNKKSPNATTVNFFIFRDLRVDAELAVGVPPRLSRSVPKQNR